ncbi:MAG: sigma-70 family RNA polymerase sigma factor, partial [Chloroflexi bacterium]|nr:sigma-70 family RNA polymerase sigma factor [Chloroflexota bacterium]
EDLTEKTFFQALANLQRYRIQSVPFTAWLYRIAHNLVANWHRDTSRHPSVQIDGLVELKDPTDDPVVAAESKEEKDELHGVIARLPADRQQLLILKFVEQMANAEIAQVMGRTEGAIKALLHRTLESLKNELVRSKEGMQDHVAKTKLPFGVTLGTLGRRQDETESSG